MIEESERLMSDIFPKLDEDSSLKPGTRRSKNICKEKHRNAERSAELTKEQRKAVQKEKNRVAAQMSRDRQKKYLEELEARVRDLEQQLEVQLCKKCRARLEESSTGEDEHLNTVREKSSESQNLLDEEPEVESLPFIRVPFEQVDFGFGKMGSFFLLSLLALAILCLSNSVQNSEGMVPSEHRLMQAVSDACPSQINQGMASPVTVPSTLDYAEIWPFSSEIREDPLSRCKNEFWQSYLNLARQEIFQENSKNLLNCNSPTLVRIANHQREDTASSDKWTFLISDPTITHAHFQENGAFSIDEVDYLEGVYQMVAEKVVLRKVLGKNCLA